MKIEPFALERWMTAHELSASYDIAESGIRPLSTNDLLAFEEPEERRAILEGLLNTPLGYSEASGSLELRTILANTYRDITHEALGLATGREMVEYPQARRHIDQTFERFTGRRPPPSAHKQAFFPDGCELVANPLGTAMGALLELEGTLFATLPGVPSEMKRMFEETLEPLIGKRSEGVIVSQLLRFAGISEEEMSEKVRDLLDSSDPTFAPLVGPGEVGRGEVQLRVTTRAPTRAEAEDKIELVAEEILSRLRSYSL